MTDNDYDVLFYAAFSYALGRMTYIVQDVAELCINNLDKIHQNTKNAMVRRIDYYSSKGLIGTPIDEEQWFNLKKAILNVN